MVNKWREGKKPKKAPQGTSQHAWGEREQTKNKNKTTEEQKAKQKQNKQNKKQQQTTKSVNKKHKLNTKAFPFWLFSYLMTNVQGDFLRWLHTTQQLSVTCILYINQLILQHSSGRQAGVVQWLGWLPSFQLAKVWFWLSCSIEKSHCYFSLVRNPFTKPPTSPVSLKC